MMTQTRHNQMPATLQVSHHPPVACVHADGPGYALHGEMMLVASFWGKSITVKSEGGLTAEVEPPNGGRAERYAWSKPTLSINNIILGKPWSEPSGDVKVICSNGAPLFGRGHVCANLHLLR